MNILWYFFVHHNVHPVHHLFILFYAGCHIDPRCFNGGMAQDVRQPGEVALQAVKGAGKEIAQIVGKDFFRADSCGFAQCFHFRPYIAPVDRSPIFSNKNRP